MSERMHEGSFMDIFCFHDFEEEEIGNLHMGFSAFGFGILFGVPFMVGLGALSSVISALALSYYFSLLESDR
jgi:hypothetical protein